MSGALPLPPGVPPELQPVFDVIAIAVGELRDQADFYGTGSPEGVVTAPPGKLYRNLAGGASTTLYVKESGTGNTGWIAK
jgi:hypothetical protein